MDAYEATKIVFSRIQSLDPENAAKIMGLLLIQDHGEKDMIRLAFGPESLVHSVLLKARKDLGLLSPPTPSLLSRQNSNPTPRSCSSPSTWATPPAPSRSTSFNGHGRDSMSSSDDLISTNGSYGVNMDFPLQEQLSFVSDSGVPNSIHGISTDLSGGGDPFYSDMGSEFPYGGLSWGTNGLCSPPGLGWKQCLYFARGYCKNGSACRFLHSPPEDAAADMGEQQQFHEQLMRSKSQRLSSSQLMASAASFVPSPTSSKCLNLLLQQQQQNENQRASAAATVMMLSADEQLKYLSRPRMDRSEYLGMMNPGSRQIYLTFPADSTFREEDVSNYFSIYGPVQDVRIPYQQKRMFGFVTFVFPETVKLILAKGNPHFVCNSRVLVKPYKEKGKVFEKKLQQQQMLMERCDLSGCSAPSGLDCRDPYDLQQLGARMLFNNKDLLLRRKMEEEQAAIDLQTAIQLQRRQFTGLQLLDLKLQNSSSSPVSLSDITTVATTTPSINIASSCPEELVHEGKASGGGTAAAVAPSKVGADLNVSEHHSTQEVQQEVVNSASAASGNDKDSAVCEGMRNEVSHCQESIEHNLPDSPFASPTKLSCMDNSFSSTDIVVSALHSHAHRMTASSMLAVPSPLDITSSFEFYPVPRFSGHRAVGM